MLRNKFLETMIIKIPLAQGLRSMRAVNRPDTVNLKKPSLLFILSRRMHSYHNGFNPENSCRTSLLARRHDRDSESRRLLFGSYWGGSKGTDWNKAVSEAEKIVGYSTSFLSLRCLLSDEMSNVAMQMRKLVGTGHPLLKTAKKLFYEDKNSMQTRGLLVLLISKAAGPAPDNSEYEDIMISGIYPKQRTLAEITEIIHTVGLIHNGLVNIDQNSVVNESRKDMEFGNKMAVLSGDFLLANASTGLASLDNTKVVQVMAIALGDLMKAEFTKLRDDEGNCILPREGATVVDWETQTFLTHGSLISNSCKAALMLANHSETLQNDAFEFGKQLSFAYRVHQELQPLVTSTDDGNDLTVTSLPTILYALNRGQKNVDPEIVNGKPVSVKKLVKLLNGNGTAVKEAKQMCINYGHRALTSLNSFPKSEALDALKNIVRAVTTF